MKKINLIEINKVSGGIEEAKESNLSSPATNNVLWANLPMACDCKCVKYDTWGMVTRRTALGPLSTSNCIDLCKETGMVVEICKKLELHITEKAINGGHETIISYK